MTIAIIEKIEAFLAGLKADLPTTAQADIKTVENDVKAIGASALTYIEANGLKDLYAIAMDVLAGAAAGAPWATTMAAVVTQGEAAGISIAKGAESVVLAQAQADMIAAGSLLPPIAAEPVLPSVTPSEPTA